MHEVDRGVLELGCPYATCPNPGWASKLRGFVLARAVERGGCLA